MQICDWPISLSRMEGWHCKCFDPAGGHSVGPRHVLCIMSAGLGITQQPPTRWSLHRGGANMAQQQQHKGNFFNSRNTQRTPLEAGELQLHGSQHCAVSQRISAQRSTTVTDPNSSKISGELGNSVLVGATTENPCCTAMACSRSRVRYGVSILLSSLSVVQHFRRKRILKLTSPSPDPRSLPKLHEVQDNSMKTLVSDVRSHLRGSPLSSLDSSPRHRFH